LSPTKLGGGRVLVVEDDEGIREMLKYNLTSAGFSVQEASDGATGLRTARTSKPDLILLDLMLPGMSGLDFCRAVRKTSQVPIIILTAKDTEVDKVVGSSWVRTTTSQSHSQFARSWLASTRSSAAHSLKSANPDPYQNKTRSPISPSTGPLGGC